MSCSSRPNDWAIPPLPPDCRNCSNAPHSSSSTKPIASVTGASTFAPITSDSLAHCSPPPTPPCWPPPPPPMNASLKMSDNNWGPVPPSFAAHSLAPHSGCQSSPDCPHRNATPGSRTHSRLCPAPASSTLSPSAKPNGSPVSCSNPASMCPPTPDKWKPPTDCSSNSSSAATN